MSKRLLTAVLVYGFILAIFGTAFTDSINSEPIRARISATGQIGPEESPPGFNPAPREAIPKSTPAAPVRLPNAAAYAQAPTAFCDSNVMNDNLPADWVYTLRPAGLLQVAQKFIGGAVNRIDTIRVEFTKKGVAPSVRIWIASIAPTGVCDYAPGVELWDTTIVAPTYSPGQTELVIPGGFYVFDSCFIGYENVTVTSGDTIRALTSEDGTCTNGCFYFNYPTAGGWYPSWCAFGSFEDLLMKVTYCTLDVPEWACGLPSDWPNEGGGNSRNGHSDVSIGNSSQCDYTLRWKYQAELNTAAGVINSNGPIVVDTFVVYGASGTYNVLNLNSTGVIPLGGKLATFTGNGAPWFVNPSGLESYPTVATVDVSGTPTRILIFAGGSPAAITAIKFSNADFPLTVADTLWQIRAVAGDLHGFPTTAAGFGNTAQLGYVVLNNKVYWATTSGLFCADAATGGKIFGPIAFATIGNPQRCITTDGINQIFVANAAIAGPVDGDVYAFNATTGALNWRLSTAVGGGLKGRGFVYPAPNYPAEGWAHGLIFDNGELWANSNAQLVVAPSFPSGGVLYHLNPATGAIVQVGPSPAGANTNKSAQLIADSKHIIDGGSTVWNPPTLEFGGQLVGFNRFSAGVDWATLTGYAPTGARHRGDGFMTCEVGGPDWLGMGNTFGHWTLHNADNGQEVWARRIDNGPPFSGNGFNRIAASIVAKTGEIIVASARGQVFCLAPTGVDRPRLHILKYTDEVNTFGPALSVVLTYNDVFENTGCATLTGTWTVWDITNGAMPGSVGSGWHSRPGLFMGGGSATSQLAGVSWGIIKQATVSSFTDEVLSPSGAGEIRTGLNPSALAGPPAFINAPSYTGAYSVLAGASEDITIDFNQSLITRGPHPFFVTFSDNDPDYFLDSAAVTGTPAQAEIVLTVTGGCAYDSVRLNFGAGGANSQAVWNSSMLGDKDEVGNMDIDGETAIFFAGSYAYAVSPERISTDFNDYDLDHVYISSQADTQNCTVPADCDPYLSAASWGTIWDGVSPVTAPVYVSLAGNQVCRAYIDSVQDFGQGGPWDWQNVPAPFDDTLTMGLRTTSRVFGAVSAPTYSNLNQLTIDYMEITERNGNAVPGWKMAAFVDYDIGSDSASINRAISAAWAHTSPAPASGSAWGFIKVPYNTCDPTDLAAVPLKNVVAMERIQSFQGNDPAARNNALLDSIYVFASRVPGAYAQGSPVSSYDDQDFFVTLDEHDFTASEMHTLVVAHFGLNGVTNPGSAATVAPVARILNEMFGYGRGDVNNDGVINIADIVKIAAIPSGGPGAIPFAHLADVNTDNAINAADATYLVSYYFQYGPCPLGKLIKPF